MIKNLEQYPIIRDIQQTSETLIDFENLIVKHWEEGKIRGPIHLSNGNEEQLIEIFKRVKTTDWVFSTWRSHYHGLLKGICPVWTEEEILKGKSITICNIDEKFYASAIVGGMNTGLAANQQQFAQDLSKYQLPLQQMIQFRAASDPGYVNPYQQVATSGPDYLTAYSNQLAANTSANNASTASKSATTSGLLGLAGTLGGAAILGGW